MSQLQSYEDILQMAWSDESFKNRFVTDPKAILAEIGIETPDSVKVEVHEDEVNLKNFVLPQRSEIEESNLEQADPVIKTLIQRSFDEPDFKAELLANPKTAVEEATGNKVPESLNIRVYENTPNLKHLVLPVNPAMEELSDLEMDAIAGGKWSNVGDVPGGKAYYPGGGQHGVYGARTEGAYIGGYVYRW